MVDCLAIQNDQLDSDLTLEQRKGSCHAGLWKGQGPSPEDSHGCGVDFSQRAELTGFQEQREGGAHLTQVSGWASGSHP